MPKRLEWTPELVAAFWDGISDSKLDEISFARLAGSELLKSIYPYLSKEGRHLDFGAGDGYFVELLLMNGFATGAMEPSPRRRAKLVARLGANEKFLGVIGQEEIDPFDVVFCSEVVEHILEPDIGPVLSRINRLLKPGGYLIVTTPNNENLEYASAYCPVTDLLFHPWQHVRSFSADTLLALLNRFGFEREFVALADFSADRDVHEAYKQANERTVLLRSRLDRWRHDAETIASHVSETIRDHIGRVRAARATLEPLLRDRNETLKLLASWVETIAEERERSLLARVDAVEQRAKEQRRLLGEWIKTTEGNVRARERALLGCAHAREQAFQKRASLLADRISQIESRAEERERALQVRAQSATVSCLAAQDKLREHLSSLRQQLGAEIFEASRMLQEQMNGSLWRRWIRDLRARLSGKRVTVDLEKRLSALTEDVAERLQNASADADGLLRLAERELAAIELSVEVGGSRLTAAEVPETNPLVESMPWHAAVVPPWEGFSEPTDSQPKSDEADRSELRGFGRLLESLKEKDVMGANVATLGAAAKTIEVALGECGQALDRLIAVDDISIDIPITPRLGGDGFDLRLGRENTLVVVVRKLHEV